MKKEICWQYLLIGCFLFVSLNLFAFPMTTASAQTSPIIQTVSPAPPTCVLRNSPNAAARLLQITGTNFSTTDYNLQFGKVSSGETSIHFRGEINWESATRLSVDIANVKHLLWGDARIVLQARLTTYTAGGFVPVSDWSPQFVLADDAANCNVPVSVSPPLTRTINVYVLNFDPLFSGQPLHQYYGWNDPNILNNGYIGDVAQVSGGTINYNIVKQSDIRTYPTKPGGYIFTNPAYQQCLDNKGSAPHCAEIIDYQATLNTLYDNTYMTACQALTSGEADEIWLWGAPWFGYWEYLLVGPSSGTCSGLNKQAAIMGFNYERGIAELLHDLSHRAENSVPTGIGFDLWDKFDGQRHRYASPQDPSFPDIDPANTHCGNTHFTPNSNKGYFYDRNLVVQSDCDDWRNWPNLSGQKKATNYTTWTAPGGDSQRDFMKWWFDHLPRNVSSFNGVYANWWHYLFPLPKPGISSLAPTQIAAGGTSFQLMVDGKDFVTTSTVVWNGQTQPTTYISRTRLTATIAATAYANPGSAEVRVFNSTPGGGFSNPQSVTVNPAAPPPAAPTNLRTFSPTKNQLNILWDNSSDNEEGFRLEYRQSLAANWQLLIDNLPINSFRYDHFPVEPGKPYYYRVRAFNAGGNSGWSNEARGIGADFTVTSASDSGSVSDLTTAGKLSYALKRASESSPGAFIAINLPAGMNTIQVTGQLPAVTNGAKLVSFCEDKPTIKLNGFGPLKFNSGGNSMKCVNVSR